MGLTSNNSLIREIESLRDFIRNGYSLRNTTLQNIDFTALEIEWNNLDIHNTIFLGCTLKPTDALRLMERGASIFTKPCDLPYNPYRSSLYTWQELQTPNNGQTVDWVIYEHFSKTKRRPSVNEALFQRIHDHAIDDSLRALLRPDGHGGYAKRCLGFMGGHSTWRSDPFYFKTAHTAQLAAQQGYFVVSGGGPGIMEAANLGAYMVDQSEDDLRKAIERLAEAPHYTSDGYMDAAMEVLATYPSSAQSLAIPTWFYGHEPSNVFASHIAKYFSNSIREDTLLAICLHGVIFAPGSAGTTQEIFMDAAQNHYGTFDFYSPMIFLGRERYTVESELYPLLQTLAKGSAYAELLYLSDDPTDIISFLLDHPPRRTSDLD